MATKTTKPAKKRHAPQAARRTTANAPPMPKGSRREGIPHKGPLPHGEESARPRDTGRHGS